MRSRDKWMEPMPARVLTVCGHLDGSLHDVTRKGDPGESDEGWATGVSADGHLLLQVCDRHGNEVRLSMTPEQAWGLKIRLENASLELKSL